VRTILNLAWIFCGTLKFGGLAVALGGVAMFGWYFVKANARSARRDAGEDARVAWGGKGAMTGAKVLALGLVAQFAAFLLMALLPGRP
jgi:hypothetical protein